MRNAVLLLAALAIGKFGYQEYMYRSATADLIVRSYSEQAMLACQVDAVARNLSESYVSWTKPLSVSLSVGRRGVEVGFWDMSNTLWNARYQNPTLVIVARKQPFRIECEYDLVERSAHVFSS